MVTRAEDEHGHQGHAPGGDGRQRSPIPALAPVSSLTRQPACHPPGYRLRRPGSPDQALAPTVDVLPPRAWRNPYTVS